MKVVKSCVLKGRDSPWKNLLFGRTGIEESLSSMKGKGSSRTKENARFLFSFHTPRENGRSPALIRFLFEEPRFDRGETPSRGEGDGFSRPRKRSQFVAATSLQRLLKFSHCYCKTFTI